MSRELLEILWYIVFVVVIGGYIILDGFDLGVGALHLLARSDRERRLHLNAIGPVWDGNEVWLVVVGGALFAGFPFAYATLCSAFYTLVMALLAALIFRAVAIEVRSRTTHKAWRSIWDWVFSIASIAIAMGLGLVLGNLITGIKLDAHHEYAGTLSDFFNPYSILLAFLTLALTSMHGAIYLVMKTEGELHDRLRRWVYVTCGAFVALYIAVTIATMVSQPHMVHRFGQYPWLFTLALANVAAIAAIPWLIKKRWDGWAFVASMATIALLLVLYSVGTFPNIVRSSDVPELFSLTISNSYASVKTLKILLLIVLIGIPLALAYFITVYYVFRGKVKLDSHSY